MRRSPHGYGSDPRWWHIHREVMSFAEFKAAAQDATEYKRGERREVMKVLAEVQERNDNDGGNDRSVSSTFVQNKADEQHIDPMFGTSRVIYISIPLTCLDTVDRAGSTTIKRDCKEEDGKPDLTTWKQRNLPEADAGTVAESLKPDSQIWMLLVGESLILTCAGVSLEALRDDLLDVEPGASFKTDAAEIHAEDKRAWLVPTKANDGTGLPIGSLPATFCERITDLAGCNPMAEFVCPYSSAHVPYGDMRGYAMKACLRSAGYGPSHSQRWNVARNFDPRFRVAGYRRLSIMSRRSQQDDTSCSDAQAQADILHKMMEQYPNAGLGNPYEKQSAGTRNQVEIAMESAHASELGDWPYWYTYSTSDTRMAIAMMATYIFDFYWPTGFRQDMTDKYWGTLEKLLVLDLDQVAPRRPGKRGHDTSDFAETLYWKVALKFTDITQVFATCNLEPSMSCPAELQTAWLHTFMALILTAENTPEPADLYLQAAQGMLDAGIIALTEQLRPVDIQDVEVCPLIGVAALCLDEYARAPVVDCLDLVTAHELNLRIANDMLLRSHQDDIRAVRHRIESSLSVLDSQLDLMSNLVAATRPPDIAEEDQKPLHVLLPLLGEPRLAPMLEASREYLLDSIERCMSMCAGLEETARWHRNMIASNKDQQEAAIAAFTMVTVIFLPLSWLSGIFGMNFIDVRDLKYGQWLYWIIAIPFASVLGAGAWWLVGADQLADLRRRRRGNMAGSGQKAAVVRPRLRDQGGRTRPTQILPGEVAAAAASVDRRWAATSMREDTIDPQSTQQGAADGWIKGRR